MRALTVIPRQVGTVRLQEIDEPTPADGDLVVETLAIGVCGTDVDIVSGMYGWAPAGAERLVIGHESLGRVIAAPSGSGFSVGDLVAGIVRRPDPVPCPYCAVGEWDMCRNGRYTERGIKERDGYASDRFALEAAFAVKVDPQLGALGVLLEPASVVAKAWDHAERIGGRSAAWQPRTALITGAGPIGLLAALLGRQRGLQVAVFDRVTDGPKPALVRELGATYLSGTLPPESELSPDVIIECTGASSVIADALTRSAAAGVVCLAGVSSGGHTVDLDVGHVNRRVVLENDAVFGSVNANRSHYVAAAAALAAADPRWLGRLITRRVPLDRWREAFARRPHDVKVVIEFAPAA
jgi:threonine dehydrogenase-like Zn-dependent dehydrogenase